MNIATIILHQNLSEEDRLKAISESTPLIVTVIDQFSPNSGKTVEFNMLSYLGEGDMKSVEALIAVNNISDYELNKDKVLVKVVQSGGTFKLSAGQLPNPYDPSIKVDDHVIRISFQVLNNDIENPVMTIEHEVSIDKPIDVSIISELQKKEVTISGNNWSEFTVSGVCIVQINSVDNRTSFYGNKKNGFIIQ